MRQVEKDLHAAMREWRSFKKGNTSCEVVQDPNGENQYMKVLLHGNWIGSWDAFELRICMAGWPTRVTISRLNALLEEFDEILGHQLGINTFKGHTTLRDDTTQYRYEMESDTIYSIAGSHGIKRVDTLGL